MERLLALEDIRRIKAEYFAAIDEKRWDDLEAVFLPDAQFGPFWAAAEPESVQQFVESVRTTFADVHTIHVAFMPIIDLLDADHATGRWSMQDTLSWAPDTFDFRDSAVPGQRGAIGKGVYRDRYQRDADGRWRISFTSLERLSIEAVVDPALAIPV
ncbi:nuclear transport factor 2 family protein [Leifsonella bigeumensis]